MNEGHFHSGSRRRTGRPRVIWQALGGVFGLAGFVALFEGVLLSTAARLAGRGAAAIISQLFGTTLLILVIPLLGLGAHCLDLADKKARIASTTPIQKGRS